VKYIVDSKTAAIRCSPYIVTLFRDSVLQTLISIA